MGEAERVVEPRSKGIRCGTTGVMLFGRLPRLKGGKSRLAAGIGDETAWRVYTLMWSMMIALLDAWRWGPRVVRYTGGRWRTTDGTPQGVEIRRQWGRSFGERLTGALRDCLSRYGTPFIVFGSDCPDLTLDDLCEAGRRLTEYDVVLGPSVDGGVYLIGLRVFDEALFRSVAWSTQNVCRDLEKNAGASGRRCFRLASKQDLDTRDDLMRLAARRPAFRRFCFF